MSDCQHKNLDFPQLSGAVRCSDCNRWFDSQNNADEVVGLMSRISELELQKTKDEAFINDLEVLLAEKQNEWISTKRAFPMENSIVLAYSEWSGLCVRQRGHDDDWYDERGNSTMNIKQDIEPVTHWKPITPPTDSEF